MAPTVITNARATSASATHGSILQASRVVDMDPDIFLLEPNVSQLVVLAQMMSKKGVHNPYFQWMEDELIPRRTLAVTTADTTTGLTMTVTDSENVYVPIPGVIQNVATGEKFLVTARAAGTQGALTVTRSWGSVAATTGATGDVFLILGSISQEGSRAPSPLSTVKVARNNYCEIVKTSFEFTGTELASELYGPNDLSYQQKKALMDHQIQIENKFIWGEPVESTAVNDTYGAMRSTGGINDLIADDGTNDFDFGGTFNLVTFFGAAEDIFRYGSKKKAMIAGPSLITNISLEGVKYLQPVDKKASFGLNVKSLESPHGDVMLMKSNELQGNTHKGWGFVLDVDNLGYRFLRGRDTKLFTNIQENDLDGRKDQYMSDVGLVRKGAKTHARITNGA